MSETLPEFGVGQRLPTALTHALDQIHSFTITDDGEVVDETNEALPSRKPSYLRGEFGANLADDISPDVRNALAADLLEGIEADIASRIDWEAVCDKAIDLLGTKLEQSTGTVFAEGSISRVWHSLLLESCLTFWANAHAEFLPAAGPAKVRDDSPDPPPGELTLAQAFEADFNHQLTTGDRGYYRDKSRMLWALGLNGTEFRKVYHDPIRKRPLSRWVSGRNLIVSAEATHPGDAIRLTERMKYTPAQVKRLQLAGWWRDCDLVQPTEQPTLGETKIGEQQGIDPQPKLQRDNRHEIYECYTEVDLGGYEHPDGIPLPYRVTIDKDSREILEVRRNWKEDDDTFEMRCRYVMYGLIPGFGFYYQGFAHLGGNAQKALTAVLRQLLDAGQFANFPGFLIAKGAGTRQMTNELRVMPGAGKEVETGGLKIGDVAMPMPYKEPSQVLMALGQQYAQDARKMLGAAEIPVGEGSKDIPVGTMLAMVEQGTKLLAAVHKGIHASDAEEFRMLQELYAEDPAALMRGNKSPARQWEMAEEFADQELVPASDPNVPSQMIRIMQSVATIQIAAMFPGQLDTHWVIEDAFRTMGKGVDPTMWAPPMPPGAAQGPPIDPSKMAAVQVKAEENQRKAAEAQLETQQRQQEFVGEIQDRAAERASQERIQGLREQTERVRLETEQQREREQTAHEAYQAHADREHKGGIAGVQMLHEAVQGHLDREHERGIEGERAKAAAAKPQPNGKAK